jgi:predicted RNA-binding Zn-ribbon protein involved in translation (DUF1610 family)
MDEIIVVKKGVAPKVYFAHTCSQCDAVLDIISTVINFNCPECEHEEVCLQDQTTIKKVYIKDDNTKSETPRGMKKVKTKTKK